MALKTTRIGREIFEKRRLPEEQSSVSGRGRSEPCQRGEEPDACHFCCSERKTPQSCAGCWVREEIPGPVSGLALGRESSGTETSGKERGLAGRRRNSSHRSEWGLTGEWWLRPRPWKQRCPFGGHFQWWPAWWPSGQPSQSCSSLPGDPWTWTSCPSHIE